MVNQTPDKRRKPGAHISLTTGRFLAPGESDPEAPEESLKVPAPLVLVLGPVLALAYIIFVPFAGMASLAMFIGRKLKGLFSKPPLLDSDE